MMNGIQTKKQERASELSHRLDLLLMEIEQIDQKIERQIGKLANCAVDDYRTEIRMSQLRLTRIDYLVGKLGQMNDRISSTLPPEQNHQVPLSGRLKLVKS
ncbi:MAG: hypothetical protein ACE3JK_06115 [Sporolactobacillus sp.]